MDDNIKSDDKNYKAMVSFDSGKFQTLNDGMGNEVFMKFTLASKPDLKRILKYIRTNLGSGIIDTSAGLVNNRDFIVRNEQFVGIMGGLQFCFNGNSEDDATIQLYVEVGDAAGMVYFPYAFDIDQLAESPTLTYTFSQTDRETIFVDLSLTTKNNRLFQHKTKVSTNEHGLKGDWLRYIVGGYCELMSGGRKLNKDQDGLAFSQVLAERGGIMFCEEITTGGKHITTDGEPVTTGEEPVTTGEKPGSPIEKWEVRNHEKPTAVNYILDDGSFYLEIFDIPKSDAKN